MTTKEQDKATIKEGLRLVIISVAYMIVQWTVLTTGVFLVLKDPWQAAGIVSCWTLYQLIALEFNKEIYGARNPSRNQVENAIQKQSKR